jgi:hypothetical protein
MSNDFNTNKNIELLWEVLLDENHVKSINDIERKKLYDLFNNHRKLFYEKEKENTSSLVTMNKKFLAFFIQFVNSKIQDNLLLQKSNVYKKEDLQMQKQTKFQKDLAEKKMDFENMINYNKPPELDFSEKIEETKIKGMDELIAKTIEQRNYEISQIQNTTYNNLDILPEQWLKTSLPIVNNKNTNTNTNINTNTTFKQIKIEDLIPVEHEVINLPNEKKISWNDSNEIKYFYKNDILMNEYDNNNEINNNSILNKLKKIEPSSSININQDIDIKTEIIQLKTEMMQYIKKVNGLEQQIENINIMLNNINLMLNNINI